MALAALIPQLASLAGAGAAVGGAAEALGGALGGGAGVMADAMGGALGAGGAGAGAGAMGGAGANAMGSPAAMGNLTYAPGTAATPLTTAPGTEAGLTPQAADTGRSGLDITKEIMGMFGGGGGGQPMPAMPEGYSSGVQGGAMNEMTQQLLMSLLRGQ